MSDRVQCGTATPSETNNDATRRIITIHNNHGDPVLTVPAPSLADLSFSPLSHPSRTLGDPYLSMQTYLLSLYLDAETAHLNAIRQYNAWVRDMEPIITPCIPGSRAHQYYLILGGLEERIKVTLAQMEDRAAKFTYIGRAREWREMRMKQYIEEKAIEKRRWMWGRGRGQGSKGKGKHELGVFPDPQCPDFEEVKVEWGHLMQSWRSADSKRPVTDISGSFGAMNLGHNSDCPLYT